MYKLLHIYIYIPCQDGTFSIYGIHGMYNTMIMLGLGVGLRPVYFRFKNKHMYIMLSNILSLRFNCVHVRGMVL